MTTDNQNEESSQERPDQRSLSIGGNADKSTIIQGDRNTIHQGPTSYYTTNVFSSVNVAPTTSVPSQPLSKQEYRWRQVVAAIRAETRLECAGETLRAALNALAVAAPDWTIAHSHPEWTECYSERMEDYHLPKAKSKRTAQAEVYGRDGLALLDAIFNDVSPRWLRDIPAIETLRKVWVQQYYCKNNKIRWRTQEEAPPASIMISSPYELDAHYAKKKTTSWVGYKVHISETCEPGELHLITNVETTAAPVADGNMTDAIHQSLSNNNMLPNKHIVDTGYLDAELLVTTDEQYQVDLLGPTRVNLHWQAKTANGYAADDFTIDWQKRKVICPQGKLSASWTPAIDSRNNEVVKIKFSTNDCSLCSSLRLCTRSERQRRSITLRPEAQYKALKKARQRASTTDYQADYALCAGIEGTLSEGIRAHGLRRARYIGLAKTHLQHLMTATAINCKRIHNWLNGVPQASTRTFSLLGSWSWPQVKQYFATSIKSWEEPNDLDT